MAGARQLGGTSEKPAVMINRFGKGKAILLNLSIQEIQDKDIEAVKYLVKQLLGWCDIHSSFGVEVLSIQKTGEDRVRDVSKLTEIERREIEIQGKEKSQVFDSEFPYTAHFTNGDIECFGLWFCNSGWLSKKRGAGTTQLRVTPPKAGHIYDLRKNEYLGNVKGFTVTMPLEGLSAYAVVPYKIEMPSLNTETQRLPGGLIRITCKIKVSPDQAAGQRHVVKFLLYAPDGKEWKDFEITKTTEVGKAQHVFMLPINAPKGIWRVEAREAISGLRGAEKVKID